MMTETTKDFIMKVIGFTLIAVSLAVGLSYANCGNGGDNGNGCSGNTGTQGPAGPQGPQGPGGSNGMNGSNGVNGVNGTNGTNGVNGKNGTDATTQFRGTDLALDAAVRLIDTKYVQLQAFDQYVFGSTPGSDVFGNGHNSTIGARVVFKLGSSYEQRENEALKRELHALEALVGRMAQ